MCRAVQPYEKSEEGLEACGLVPIREFRYNMSLDKLDKVCEV